MSAKHKWHGPEFEAKFIANVKKALLTSAIIVAREMKLQLSKSASPSEPGQPPGAATGTLRRSVQIDSSGLSDTVNPKVRVGPNTPYAKILEYGGVIRAKNVRALPVPIGAAGRAARRAAGASIRSLDLFLIRRKGRPPFLARKAGRGAIQPLFVLKPSVTIAARPYVRPTLKAVRRRIRSQFTKTRLLAGIR